jgi:hypothetical protein
VALPPGAPEVEAATMLHDHHVKYCCEEEIARIASEWRRAGDIYNHGYFDIVAFVEKVLSKRLRKPKQDLIVAQFDCSLGDRRAYVSFNPITLHVDSEVWELAKLGGPDARFIIAHEIGHIILHDDRAKAFSIDPSLNIRFAGQEHSAEWQANTFAGYFLLPDHLVRSFGDFNDLSASCSVLKTLAQDRMESVQKVNRKAKNSTGDVCPKCGNFTLVGDGTCSTCDTSGGTTGCS